MHLFWLLFRRRRAGRCIAGRRGLVAAAPAAMAAAMAVGAFERTLYTSCFSGQTGRYYWSTYDDPAIRYVSLADAAGAPTDLLVTPEPRA